VPSPDHDIAVTWYQDAHGPYARDFDDVMTLFDLFGRVDRERLRWRRLALAWPWVCAGLVFGWALSLWMVSHG